MSDDRRTRLPAPIRVPGLSTLGLLIALTSCNGGPEPAPGPKSHGPAPGPTTARPLPGDVGQRAYDQVEKLVGFGARHAGTPGWRSALDLIESELRDAGLEPQRDTWVEPESKIEFSNVSAVIAGGRPDRIVIGCHHDTKITSGHPDPVHNFEFVGANDSGSGVGLLLELAREFAASPPAGCSVEVVFFDGEESLPFHWDPEQALFGSTRFVANYQQEARVAGPDHAPIRAMVLLDMVGARDLTLDDETLSTPELKRMVWSAAGRLGYQHYLFANRLRVRDDHKPFLDAGIPAIDLIDIADNPQWHTPDDTLEHLSAKSMQIVGEIVWEAFPAIVARYVPAADGD